jgi:hypothetical protein
LVLDGEGVVPVLLPSPPGAPFVGGDEAGGSPLEDVIEHPPIVIVIVIVIVIAIAIARQGTTRGRGRFEAGENTKREVAAITSQANLRSRAQHELYEA